MTPRNMTPEEARAINIAVAQVLELAVVDEQGFGLDPVVIGEPRPAVQTAAAAPSLCRGESHLGLQTAQLPAAMLQTPGGHQ